MTVISLQDHRRKAVNNFTRAAELIESKAVLIPCADTDDICLQGGYRMDSLNEIFGKLRNATQTDEEWMFLQLYKLMKNVQDESGEGGQSSEARERLLAIMIGLSEASLARIKTFDLAMYRDTAPADAALKFCAMATGIRREHAVRSNFGEERSHTADVFILQR